MAEPASEPTASSAPAAHRLHAASVQQQARRRLRGATPAAWLHGEVARRMAERLVVIKAQPRRVLDWWATLGGSAALLRRQYPAAQFIGAEPATLQHLLPTHAAPAWWQKLLGSAAPEAMRVSDAAALEPAAQLLWANMMLHWVDDLPPLLARWHASLATDGFLMFSCFGPDTLRELHGVYARMGWGAPASAFIDMHDLGDALVHAGFADPVMDMEVLTLTWDSPEALLAELRGLGGNTALARLPGLRTPRWRQRLSVALAEQLGDGSGRLSLSFEIIYGHAFKPTPRLPVAARTEISLDAMRGLLRAPGPAGQPAHGRPRSEPGD